MMATTFVLAIVPLMDSISMVISSFLALFFYKLMQSLLIILQGVKIVMSSVEKYKTTKGYYTHDTGWENNMMKDWNVNIEVVAPCGSSYC